MFADRSAILFRVSRQAYGPILMYFYVPPLFYKGFAPSSEPRAFRMIRESRFGDIVKWTCPYTFREFQGFCIRGTVRYQKKELGSSRVLPQFLLSRAVGFYFRAVPETPEFFLFRAVGDFQHFPTFRTIPGDFSAVPSEHIIVFF